MTDTRGTGTGPMWNGVPEEDAVRALLEEAGPRAPLAEADLAAIEATARVEWRRRYGAGRTSGRRGRWWMAVAAAALLAFVGLLWRAQTPTEGSSVEAPSAAIALLTGTARVKTPGEPAADLAGASAIGRFISEGSEIETEEASRLALRTPKGASVRLDAATRVRLLSPALVQLDQGTVYVDTGGGEGGSDDVAVRTPAGLFQPVGTRFEVRVEPGGSATRLRVREGTVTLEGRGGDAAFGAGQQLIVRNDGSLARGSAPEGGPEWSWVLRAAPMLDIEGVKVKEFLDWIAREAGWRVEFADREAASRADSTVLHGSIDHLTPEESPAVVLSSCGLGHRVSKGTLIVFVAGESGR